MRLKLWPRSANSSRPEIAMRWDRSPSASLPVPRNSSASGARKPRNSSSTSASVVEHGERGVDLADALEPAQQLCGVGVDPDHLGGLVGHADLDQLVELLVDAAFEEIDQPLPGDVGAAAAPQLLDFAQADPECAGTPVDLVRRIKFDGFGFGSSDPTMASSLLR